MVASTGQWTGGDALVFIHGYRVAFKDALYTVAKIVKDIDFKGRAYLYSWPSRESLAGYFEDLDNSEQAEPFFQSFMRMLMRDAHIYEIDLIAHSMGSQSMLRALAALRPIFDTERAGAEGRSRRGKVSSSIRIGQMIFAAPDVRKVGFQPEDRPDLSLRRSRHCLRIVGRSGPVRVEDHPRRAASHGRAVR